MFLYVHKNKFLKRKKIILKHPIFKKRFSYLHTEKYLSQTAHKAFNYLDHSFHLKD